MITFLRVVTNSTPLRLYSRPSQLATVLIIARVKAGSIDYTEIIVILKAII